MANEVELNVQIVYIFWGNSQIISLARVLSSIATSVIYSMQFHFYVCENGRNFGLINTRPGLPDCKSSVMGADRHYI